MAIHFTAEILNLSWGKLFFIIRPDKKVFFESFECNMVLVSTSKIFKDNKIASARRASAI